MQFKQRVQESWTHNLSALTSASIGHYVQDLSPVLETMNSKEHSGWWDNRGFLSRSCGMYRAQSHYWAQSCNNNMRCSSTIKIKLELKASQPFGCAFFRINNEATVRCKCFWHHYLISRPCTAVWLGAISAFICLEASILHPAPTAPTLSTSDDLWLPCAAIAADSRGPCWCMLKWTKLRLRQLQWVAP